MEENNNIDAMQNEQQAVDQKQQPVLQNAKQNEEQPQQEEDKKEPRQIRKNNRKKELVKHMVDSSNLEWVAYDKDKQILYVQFRNGGLYNYEDVPEKIFNDLLHAGSKGRYHAVKIKWKYKYNKMN